MDHNLFCILNVNKSTGMTSHDVVSLIRRRTGLRRIGHGGTLDPDATGVLPVLVGKATRLSSYVLEMDKRYLAEMTLGIVTDTLDASGQIIRQTTDWTLSIDKVRQVASQFVGMIMQIPPMVSALKIGGKRLYELARDGKTVAREARPVTIHALHVQADEDDGEGLRPGSKVLLDVTCSKGTYIRTLCDDIGRELGCGAHMSSLIRTRVGPFHIENAVTIEELQRLADIGELSRVMASPRVILDFIGMPWITVEPDDEAYLRQGQAISLQKQPDPTRFSNGESIYVTRMDGSVLCLAKIDTAKGLILPYRVF